MSDLDGLTRSALGDIGQLVDADAEMAVIGAAMHSATATAEATRIVRATDFYQPSHEAAWTAITELVDAGNPVDMITVTAHMRANGTLPAAGPVFIFDCYQAGQPEAVHAHARIVADLAARRRVVTAGIRSVQLAYGLEAAPRDVATMAAEEMTSAVRTAVSDTPTIVDQVTEALDELEGQAVSEWDWPWLDLRDLLLPPRPGQFILFAARPSVGKSVTLLDIARDVALRQGKPVVLFSLEMASTEVLHRLIAAEARIPLTRLQERELDDTAWARIADVTARIMEAPLTIIDSAEASIGDIRREVRDHKPAVLLVDYIQLAKTNPAIKDRRQGLEELSRKFKVLAKEEKVTVVSAAQLRRAPQGKEAEPPSLSDLRETGSLEQDSDTVVMIHREDMEDPESPRAGEADMLVRKQRNGPRGKRTLAAQLHYARFVDMAH